MKFCRVLLTKITEYLYRYTITNIVFIYRTLILRFDTLSLSDNDHRQEMTTIFNYYKL